MEEFSVTAIVLNSFNYREKDKILHLFSLELGNISAILKGVASPKAKLKFAGQPFCFAKFDLVKSNEFYVVKNVDLIDAFFDLTADYENFLFATSMLEVCNHILKPGIISEGLFVTLLKTLKNIVYNNIDIKLSIIKFYLILLELMGYKLNFDKCDNCNMSMIGEIRFDLNSGAFRCRACSSGEDVSKQDFINLKFINSTDIDRLHTLKIGYESINNIVKIIINNVCRRLNYSFKSFKIDDVI